MSFRVFSRGVHFFLVSAGVLLLSAMVSGCFYVSGKGFLGGGVRPLKETVLSGKGSDKILVMEVTGLISETERSGFMRLSREPSTVAQIKEQLDKAVKDERIKGVLLLINSPGGTVTASDIIYNEIKGFKSHKRVKIAALILGVGASGAYYVAQASDLIMAHPTAITGSVGVILMNLNFSGLMEKVGVTDMTIKSGANKDLGSPFRKPEKEGEEILQGVVDSFQSRFCEVIKENRPSLNLDEQPELVDGRIFSAQQALEAGLVDKIGYYQNALDWLKKSAGISEARIVRYARSGEFVPNVYAAGAGAQGFHGDINLIKLDVEGLLAASGPSFMYLWLPGLHK